MANPASIPTKSATWRMRSNAEHGHHHLSPDCLVNLEQATVPTPTVQPGHALVRLEAASLNWRDLLLISASSMYPPKLDPGTAPCCDGAGTIAASNPGSAWAVGARVVLAPNAWRDGADVRDFDHSSVLGTGAMQGTLREYLLVPEERLLPAPAHLTMEEAASLPTAWATAARCLFFGPCLTAEGTTVLTMGTGGVSMAAVQLAAAKGAKVFALSSADDKLKLARDVGAAETINYKTVPDWDQEVLRRTDGRGVDHVVDVGGGSTIMRSIRSARTGGLISVVGILGEGDETGVVAQLLFGGKTAQGTLSFTTKMVEKMLQVVDAHKIRPHVAEVFSFKDAPEAFEAMMSQSKVGKIVIKM